jgi:hypothetical protein
MRRLGSDSFVANSLLPTQPRKGDDRQQSRIYAYTAALMTENMMLRDAEEGIDAFLQKRLPSWCD